MDNFVKCEKISICRLERKCKEDTVVEGYKFRKGMSAVIPVYALHYDPETWPNPEKFDPDRYRNKPTKVTESDVL